MAEPFVRVADTTELAEGEMMLVHAHGRDLLLARVEGQFYAMDNECTHAGEPLHQGKLRRYKVQCPLHWGVFDVRTGEVLEEPPWMKSITYPAKVDGDSVLVGPPPPKGVPFIARA